jgi:hypothetical protein
MEQFQEIEQAVTGVVHHFAAMRSPGDLEDLRADAWRVALEVMEAGRYDPKLGTLAAYLNQAIRWGLGRQIQRQYAAEMGGQLQHRLSIEYFQADEQLNAGLRRHQPLPTQLVDQESPEVEALEAERIARYEAWRRRARAAIRRAFGTLDRADRKIVQRLWGLDGRAPERDCRRLARTLKVSVDRVYRLRPSRLRRRLGEVEELRDLHRESFEIREQIENEKE